MEWLPVIILLVLIVIAYHCCCGSTKTRREKFETRQIYDTAQSLFSRPQETTYSEYKNILNIDPVLYTDLWQLWREDRLTLANVDAINITL